MTGLAPDFDLLRDDWPIFAATDARVTRTLNVTAAWDGAQVAKVAVAGERHVQDALFAAFSMFRQKDRWLSVDRRIELLEKMCALLDSHRELLATESARESGKALIDARREVQRARDCAETAIACLRDDQDEVFPVELDANRSTVAETAHQTGEPVLIERVEPGGVVVAVLAANHGLELAARYLFAALAAGCPIIIKPSVDAPLSCLRLVHMLHEVGLPYVWSQCVVTQSHAVTLELVRDPRVALFCFVGSADLGWSLRAGLPPGTRCMLDHGGVTPAIVASDADPLLTRSALLAGAFCCAGQDSLSIQRVYLPTSWAGEFAQQLAVAAAELSWGDPRDESTRVGPLIRPAEVTRIHQWVTDAVEAGAQLLGGGFALNERCYSPTVLLNPPIDALVSTQPCFGPVLCLYACDDILEACDRANALPYALVAAIFTETAATAHTLFKALDASAVLLNASLAELPERLSLQGLRRSGLGARGVLAGIEAMQLRKALVC